MWVQQLGAGQSATTGDPPLTWHGAKSHAYAHHCRAAIRGPPAGRRGPFVPATPFATLTSLRPRTASAVPASLSSRRTVLAAAHLCPLGGAGASQPLPLPVPPPPGQPRPPRGARPGAASSDPRRALAFSRAFRASSARRQACSGSERAKWASWTAWATRSISAKRSLQAVGVSSSRSAWAMRAATDLMVLRGTQRTFVGLCRGPWADRANRPEAWASGPGTRSKRPDKTASTPAASEATARQVVTSSAGTAPSSRTTSPRPSVASLHRAGHRWAGARCSSRSAVLPQHSEASSSGR